MIFAHVALATRNAQSELIKEAANKRIARVKNPNPTYLMDDNQHDIECWMKCEEL